MTRFTFILGAMALGLAAPVSAQTVLSGDHSVDGDLCVGGACTNSEVFFSGFNSQLKVKGSGPGIVIEDTGGTSTNDWMIQGNDTNEDSISIGDITSGTVPFKVMGAAPDNSLLVAADGKIGLGTMLPTANLHLMSNTLSEIRFEAANSSVYNYLLRADEFNFTFFSQSPGIERANVPRVVIRKDAPPFAFTVDTGEIRIGQSDSTYDFRINGAEDPDAFISNGPLFFADASANRVGIGTGNPNAPFELSGPDTFNFFRITAKGALNDSVDITYTGGPLGTGQLRYNIVDGDAQEMSLDADGNVVIDGTLTTAGPTCASGCDRVFDADYPLPSITERASTMFAEGHLPALGPTQPGEPVNVTEKLAGAINELEHAHIYIDQLNNQLSAVREGRRADHAMIAQLQAQQAELLSRLTLLEAQ